MKIISIIILLFCIQVNSQTKFDKIDNILNEAFEKDIFSGVVLIADKSDIQYLKAFGYADWDNKIINQTDTKFNIGSIGKLFTQILITQLIQEEKLNLNDNLKNLYPLFNNELDEKITVKMLLTFSSGLGDYLQLDEFRREPNRYRKVEDLISLISEQPLLFEPGTSRRYSNSGYVVLGGIIEKLTGKSYYDVLKERILYPLGMNNSGFIYKDDQVENKAKGFLVTPTGNKESTYERMPNIPTPAGGMYSTAGDMLKLDRSLIKDNILLEDEFKVLLHSRFNEDIKSTWTELLKLPDFGLGVAGGSPGWNAVYDQNVTNKYSVIILANIDQGAEALIERINAILKGENYEPLRLDLGRYIFNVIEEKGITDFVENYKEYLSEYEIANDRILNRIGYQFLNEGLNDEAIAIFTVNVKCFPNIGNTYDSLAEAYMKNGDKKNAIINYKKALELDPGNKNAEEMLNKLK